jgi:hypothetical protein
MKNRKKFLGMVSVLLCAVIISVFAACSSSAPPQSTAEHTTLTNGKVTSSAGATAGMADSDAADAMNGKAAEKVGTASTAAAAAAMSNQKIIQQLSYQIETMKFDESAKTVQSLCAELGGYLQDSSVNGKGIREQGSLRSASYILRIPQGKLDQLKNSAGNIGNVLNFTTSSQNVSEQYFDTEARLKSLRTQQERLLALLKKSGSLTDVIALEKALADVNYQIEQFTGTLRQYDSFINYSTVTIQLDEVMKPTELEQTPITLGDKIALQFKQSMRALGAFGEGLLVLLIGGAPILLLLAVVVAAVIFIVLKRGKRTHKKSKEFMPLLTTDKTELEKGKEHPDK